MLWHNIQIVRLRVAFLLILMQDPTWCISCVYHEAGCGQLSELLDVLVRDCETMGSSQLRDMNIVASYFLLLL